MISKNINWRKWYTNQNLNINENNIILIFEGNDMTGKSTLISIIKDIFPQSLYFHTSAPPGNIKDNNYYPSMLSHMIPLIKDSQQPFIIDRFHLGEVVYGSIFRNRKKDLFSNNQLLTIDKNLENMDKNIKIIYLETELEELIKRYHRRGDWFVKEEDLSVINHQYQEVIKESNLPILKIDTTSKHNIIEKVYKILEFINK